MTWNEAPLKICSIKAFPTYVINQLEQTIDSPNARQSLMIPMLELQDTLAAATAKARVSQNFHSY